MKLHEVSAATGLTRKAVEWYQKQGFVRAAKDASAYKLLALNERLCAETGIRYNEATGQYTVAQQ